MSHASVEACILYWSNVLPHVSCQQSSLSENVEHGSQGQLSNGLVSLLVSRSRPSVCCLWFGRRWYIIHSCMGRDSMAQPTDRPTDTRTDGVPALFGTSTARTGLSRHAAQSATMRRRLSSSTASDVSVPTRNGNLQITNARTCYPPYQLASQSPVRRTGSESVPRTATLRHRRQRARVIQTRMCKARAWYYAAKLPSTKITVSPSVNEQIHQLKLFLSFLFFLLFVWNQAAQINHIIDSNKHSNRTTR